eukprot:8755796-Lingulodinium_polyedra.AAC.1
MPEDINRITTSRARAVSRHGRERAWVANCIHRRPSTTPRARCLHGRPRAEENVPGCDHPMP